MSMQNKERELTGAQAVREAISQEMQRDENVFVMGLNVDDPKGLFGTTKDLHKEFHPDRNFDTPLSEDAMTGVAIGAAIAGLRPIHVHQRMDFLMLAMNQLVNIAAKYNYMYGGNVSIPLVVRGVIGRSWGQGPQHSQSLFSLFAHVPGLKVVAPTTPHDTKGALTAAIRDNNPVVFIEHRLLHTMEGVVPEEPYETPLGKARVLSEGKDITIVAISHCAVEAVRAKNYLKTHYGLNAEIIDPITLSPLDMETVYKSVMKTGRLLVVEHDWVSCGISAEILTQFVLMCQERGNQMPLQLDRMGFAPTPCPTTRCLETLFYPSAKTIAEKSYKMVTQKDDFQWNDQEIAKEVAEFKGPF